MFSSLFYTLVPHVPVAHKNEGQRNFHFFHRNCLSEQLPFSMSVAYRASQPSSYLAVCTYFLASSKVPPGLPIFVNRIVGPRLGRRAPHRQQHSSASFRENARQYSGPAQTRERCKPAMPDVPSSLSPCRPHSAPASLQIFYDQLSRQSVPGYSSVSIASVQLLVSHVDG